MTSKLNLGFAAIIIIAFIYGVFAKEEIIDNGEVIYLKLAPVDPRSLMQGDYMRLRYDISDEARNAEVPPTANSGYIVLDLNADNVGFFSRFDDGNKILVSQRLFKFHWPNRSARIDIMPDSFLFQQGLAALYAEAKYAMFKIYQDEHLLVGLADDGLIEIKPPTAQN